MDHGYAVNEDKRCIATTKKDRQCQLRSIVGIELCALHSGLARSKRSKGYGDPRALAAFKLAHAK